MKESNFHNRVNAKPILEIVKGKIVAWESYRKVCKGRCTLANGEVSGKQIVGSSSNIKK